MARVIFISETSVRDAWVSALAQVLCTGYDIRTVYDKHNMLPSKDATVLIDVKEPLSNPIMHNKKIYKIKTSYGNFYEVYGSMADIFLIGSIQSGYIEEIMHGVNDHLIRDSKVSFPYSYYDRIFNYTPFSLEDTVNLDYELELVETEFVKNHQKLIKAKKIRSTPESNIWTLQNGLELDLDKEISKQIGIEKLPMSIFNFPRINQINDIIFKLKKNPESRRAQAITWRPIVDSHYIDTPCLQRIYMRVIEGKLIMHTTWRGRDLFRAWEANINGMIRIQMKVADELGVELGNHLDFSNSLHIYGVNIANVKDIFKRMKIKGEKFPVDIEDLVKKITS
ncbi:MAG: thymidylate synthase [Promethearchaeota archaeon]